jgi:hypothetical protein
MATDEGVEDEQTRAMKGDGCLESVELIRETDASLNDHAHRQSAEISVTSTGQRLQALEQDGGRVFGG